MFYYKHSGGPGFGVWPEEMTGVKFTNRTGATRLRGDIVMIDEGATATESTTLDAGVSTSGLQAVVVPSVDGSRNQTFAVAEEDVADNADGLFTICSRDIEVQSEATVSLATNIGVPQASDTMDVLLTSTPYTGYLGQKIIGRPLEIASAGLIRYRFCGFGIGQASIS